MKARLLLAALSFSLTGCDTTDSGSTHTTVYYGVGYYDPWYYHGCYDCDHDHNHKVEINPPPGGRDWDSARPSHPIAGDRPSFGDRPSVSPRPSIPSSPRPSPRGGGGRRGR